ncbi:hypothetical protein PIIN_01027 [Serendipita indica DSM 11827]|uniref:TECPR1-like DysF domain-containing protein n=1 Tax=Serendipita indica (strain DSM 11827) TaxID=1109443 RepID=G4T749_SERID|nr:hypothetical protein PIIN_01027 [Serendipita indica DSM 11827]
MQASSSAERDKFELAALRDVPTLLDFVASVPAPVTKVLVEFAYPIRLLNRFAFAASWKSSAEQSFLVLFAWVSICLYGGFFVRYVSLSRVWERYGLYEANSFALIPIIILGPVILPRLPQRFQHKKSTLTTEESLAASLSDLDGIYALRPDFTLRDPLPSHLSFQERLRVLGFILIPFITLTYWASLRVLLAIAGALVLTYRAPWAINSKKAEEPTNAPTNTVNKHAFMFTVLENQRWWVGIDWTAALLPSERPSWCAPITPGSLSSTQGPNQLVFHALPPPASFPLPPSTSVTLPSPSGKGFIKKTAKWKWEDDSEWEVIVHKEGEDKIRKLRPPLKASHPEEDNKGQLLAKAAGKISANPSPTTSSFAEHEAGTSGKPLLPSAHPENEFTDQDGWIYGDNKWENLAGKAGMGKFTRFRRWCRVAILEETEESVDEPDAKVTFTQLEARRSHSPEKEPAESLVEKPSQSRARSETKGSPERSRGRTTDSRLSVGGESSLQQRLKAALKSNT